MDVFSIIISLLKSTSSLIIAPLKKIFCDKPKIYFDFEQGAHRMFVLDEEIIPSFEKIRRYELMWNYIMYFRNNTEHDAYNIKLLFPTIDENFKIKGKINLHEPIESNKFIKFDVEFIHRIETTGLEADQTLNSCPPYLKEKKFVLEYTNASKRKFYTVYDHTEPEDLRNQFQRNI